MSYLIAMYVFYHGNNLPIFGFIPGSQKDEKPLNQGMERMPLEELSKVLPEDVAESIVENRKVTKLLDYESILRKAIEESQNETAKLMNSKNLGMNHHHHYFQDHSYYQRNSYHNQNNRLHK